MHLCIVALLVVFSSGLMAQDKSKKKVSATVLKEVPFYVKKSFKGTVFSADVKAIRLESKHWLKWTVEEAVSHGSVVKKGDVLVKFDVKDFDAALLSRRRALESQEIAFDKMQKSYDITLKKMALDLKKAELSTSLAFKKYTLYKEKGRARELSSQDERLMDVKLGLEYQLEELKQLEKMYKGDRITEETEEIVLKRQRNTVEKMKNYVKAAELQFEQAHAYKIPFADFLNIYNEEKSRMDLVSVKLESDFFKKSEALKLATAKVALKKARSKFTEFVGEKKYSEIRADRDGVIIYGSIVAGKWTNKGTVHKKGAVLSAKSLVFSIVNPNEFVFKAQVDVATSLLMESKAAYFLSVAGLEAKKLTFISKKTVPVNGSFEVLFKVVEGESLFHGLSATGTLVNMLNSKGLVVAKAAIKVEAMDPTKKYTWVVKEGKKVKVYVKVGLEYQGKTLVLEGLHVGDAIAK